ncbi:hypothetical protein DOTSEDRAFT_27045 [Dothistroma septosporum NZE10]|uniref:BTB domain-containing protein n=1 Tax=Dothistroma septosporum (strain NZE10 / CBS 128990) TaxID=675120 RepID=N1PII1_DOTSN|nr:hypothetical protein DOTSEDRAFT_27045 [Dothistroma septosporum NZE10]
MTAAQGDIAPGGDVILIVGDDKKRLQVSSTMLFATSSVFKALLGPHFREGQQPRSAAMPVEVALPDDDFMADAWLCALVHHKPAAELEENRDVRHMLAFAIVVDKYDSIGALRLQSRALMMRFTECKPSADHSDVTMLEALAAAYLLGDLRSFRKISANLIAHTTGQVGDLRKLKGAVPMLPDGVLFAMEEKRDAARDVLVNQMMRIARCRYNKSLYDYYGFLSKLATKLGAPYWPPFVRGQDHTTLEYAVQVLRSFGDCVRSCGLCSSIDARRLSTISAGSLLDIANMVASSCRGLCLQCVLENEQDLTTKCKEHVQAYE